MVAFLIIFYAASSHHRSPPSFVRVTPKKIAALCFLAAGCEEMAVYISLTRKRSSASCESGQSSIADGPGASAALSSAIADMIVKNCLSYTRYPTKKAETKDD
mmetsp:Transcript_24036/g.47978  ORF Transcript_24036/g.47978 Transcript_24036/m.47978 type:complete len:103 (+) Transcript_24036:20-328(+)